MTSASARTRLLFERLYPDAAALAQNLRETHVELVLPRPSPASEIACALAATLLLRLADDAPHIHFLAPAVRTTALPRLADAPLFDALRREHDGFASVDRFSCKPAASATIRVTFGEGDGITATSRGWGASFGVDGGESDGNPLGAALTGVIAANEVFKAALAAAGVEERRVRPWRGCVSGWDYSLAETDGPSLDAPVDLSRMAFVGCGGIASAAIWALALLPVAGRVLVVDHDVIDETNLNRHLTANYGDIDSGKAALAASMLEAAGAETAFRAARWQDLDAADRRTAEVAVVSVDDDPTRRDVQLSLPRLVVNAGTSDDGLYQVTRHDFVNGACLCCIARADQIVANLEDNVARYLGLPVDEFLRYSRSSDPLPHEVLARIREDEREHLTGVPAREITRIVCGRLRLPGGGPAVSAPTLSAMPGILLAAEAVKVALQARTKLDADDNALVASVLRGPHARWLMRRKKRGDCVCGDDLYRDYYVRKWETLGAAS